ncbi:hypothetical protein Nepgr_005868 [Nepenthes gracilis]|uniref:Uncharacterized protein n=1 Tax=Nepenthes gracilis TaxID=150966 RepID=A0AAD3S4C0_NEPGR|nr:hypothetical protein Nepgr_005868 [Nepenthes gracilis]
MGIDLLKSTTEDQMDMVRELGGHYGSGGSTAELPIMEFYGSGAGDSVNDDNVAAAVMPPIIFDCSRPPFTLFNHPCSMEFSINAPAHHRNPLPTASVLPSSAGGENWSGGNEFPSQKQGSMAAKREMIFRIAAMRPIYIDPESVRPPRRRNVKISKDPQSVAAL